LSPAVHESPFVSPGPWQLLPQDILAIKLLEEEKLSASRRDNKFFFDWDKKFSLSGVFVPLSGGGYTLFLSGAAVKGEVLEKLQELMSDLAVTNIRYVSRQVLETMAAGAIDLKS
jgi:hypothetical protein